MVPVQALAIDWVGLCAQVAQRSQPNVAERDTPAVGGRPLTAESTGARGRAALRGGTGGRLASRGGGGARDAEASAAPLQGAAAPARGRPTRPLTAPAVPPVPAESPTPFTRAQKPFF
jgi:hypothetical protein